MPWRVKCPRQCLSLWESSERAWRILKWIIRFRNTWLIIYITTWSLPIPSRVETSVSYGLPIITVFLFIEHVYFLALTYSKEFKRAYPKPLYELYNSIYNIHGWAITKTAYTSKPFICLLSVEFFSAEFSFSSYFLFCVHDIQEPIFYYFGTLNEFGRIFWFI